MDVLAGSDALIGLVGGTFAGGLAGGTRLLRLGGPPGLAGAGGLAGATGLLRLWEALAGGWGNLRAVTVVPAL